MHQLVPEGINDIQILRSAVKAAAPLSLYLISLRSLANSRYRSKEEVSA